MNNALVVLVVAVSWAVLFFAEQEAMQVWSWMIIASAIFAMTSLGFVFLGFFARRGRRYPFFIAAAIPLFLSVALMFVGHEEHEDLLGKIRAERRIQEKIYMIQLGRM
ncbi:MAG: hypothetical protein IPK84_04285 [Candidatus Moraniibacteriota bacterium]|nr:MAG: hypothetical protein IPK84_04285 [Candidatus Moranbacteria bacterium]